MCVECDVELLKVAFDMREVERSKSGVGRSKTLVTCMYTISAMLVFLLLCSVLHPVLTCNRIYMSVFYILL